MGVAHQDPIKTNRSRFGSETRACLDVGVAMGYIGVPDACVLERLGQVIGTPTRVAKQVG